MALTIGDDMITSDRCAAVATWRPAAAADCAGAWVSTRLAKRLLSRQEAVNSRSWPSLKRMAASRRPSTPTNRRSACCGTREPPGARQAAGGFRVRAGQAADSSRSPGWEPSARPIQTGRLLDRCSGGATHPGNRDAVPEVRSGSRGRAYADQGRRAARQTLRFCASGLARPGTGAVRPSAWFCARFPAHTGLHAPPAAS